MIKNLPAKARDVGLIPGSGRSTGEGNGNPLRYSCLGNPMDRAAWWAIVRGVAKDSDTTQQQNASLSYNAEDTVRQKLLKALKAVKHQHELSSKIIKFLLDCLYKQYIFL